MIAISEAGTAISKQSDIGVDKNSWFNIDYLKDIWFQKNDIFMH